MISNSMPCTKLFFMQTLFSHADTGCLSRRPNLLPPHCLLFSMMTAAPTWSTCTDIHFIILFVDFLSKNKLVVNKVK